MTPRTLAFAALLACAASAARAGEAACWFENGVVVVPAEVMGVAGDYILDTGQAQTQLAETQAQSAGFEATAPTGEVRLAGQRLEGRPVAVADLDVRAGLFPTPIAGVIGADVLRGVGVDVTFAPCRVRLST
ncbi:MAG: aspartyl protease family protein, partial [Phenylobacterium sp.]